MRQSDDMELVGQYALGNSQAAFAALVERHVNLVYSVAMRKVGNSHASQEITQAVFIILARKARCLGRDTVLSAWLYQTARLTAANFLRSEIRRSRREQEACMQSLLNQPEPEAWPQIAPLIEDAMGRLSDRDRSALVLRFFENKTLSEVGMALGSSEDAAKMRVNRALEKLRKFFTKRGVTLSASTLAASVSANSVQAAPAGFATTIAAAAVKGSAVAVSTSTLVKGALEIMAWTKVKTGIVIGVAVLLAAGTTTVVVNKVVRRSAGDAGANAMSPEAFQEISQARIEFARIWLLACFMYAEKHQNQFPSAFSEGSTSFAQAKGSRAPGAPNISNLDASFEIVYSGKQDRIHDYGRTVLIREKKPRRNPNGGSERIYGFADGHVEWDTSADGDFNALERQKGYIFRSGNN